MKTLSSTEFRKNLSDVMDQVNDDVEAVVITRAKGRPAVLVSLDDFNALQETAYLLSSNRNAKRLGGAGMAALSGGVIEKSASQL